MDATITSVVRLWEQKCSHKEIARRLNISEQKVLKILVTVGAVETEELKLYKAGLTAVEIAEKMEKSKKAVISRLPYEKGIYNAEYPTINAIRIKEFRKKKGKENE